MQRDDVTFEHTDAFETLPLRCEKDEKDDSRTFVDIRSYKPRALYLDHTNIAMKPVCSNLERKDCCYLSLLSRVPSVRRSSPCLILALTRVDWVEIFLRLNRCSNG